MTGIIKYKGASIAFKVKGEGPALVLLHGFMEDKSIWEPYAKHLSSEFTVITVDLPGHGKSEVVRPIHTMDMMAVAVNKVLQRLEIRRCVMIGHSMGGYVTLSFIRKYPGKIKGFGLFHSHAAEDTSQQKVDRNRTIKLIENDKQNFIINFFPDLFAPENADNFSGQISKLQQSALGMTRLGIIAALEGMKLRVDSHDVLKKAKVPVLFIIGKKDQKIPAEKIMHQAMIPAESDVLVLENVGHMGFIEARKKCLKSILHFARKCL